MFSLVLVAIISNSSYSSIAPILPLEIVKHGIQEQFISLIFLFFPIGYSLTSLVVGRYLESMGTHKVMSLGMAFQALLFYWLGYIFELPIKNNNSSANEFFILVGLLTLTEFFLGCSMSMIATGYYSMATLVFSSEKESAMSCIEAAVGTGYIVGPIIGSAIYDEMGYQSAYKTVSFGMALMAFITWKILFPCLKAKARCNSGDDLLIGDPEAQGRLIPCNDLKNDQHEQMNYMSLESQPINETMAQGPSAMTLLKIPKITIAAMSILWINVSWTFMEPILATRLVDLHVGKKWIGIIFGLVNIVYVPSAFLMQHFPKRFERHSTITISMVLTPFSVLMTGSIHFPLLIAGVICVGFFPTPVWIMLLPTMQEDVSALFPDPSLKRSLNDVTAGIYNSFMTLGQVVGYIIGPLLNGRYGFAITTWVVAVLIFLQSLVYYYFGTGAFERWLKSRRRLRSARSFVNLT